MHDLDRVYRENEAENETFEFEFNSEGEWNEVFNETELNELASELLEVSQEQELEQFLGRLIKRVGKSVGKAIQSPVGRALGAALKAAAKQALPVAGAAAGNVLLPGLGGAIGGKLGSMASNALGLEMEGLSQEDREFEVAKQFVRIATDATQKTLASPNPNGDSRQIAVQAIRESLQKHAPGMAAQARTAVDCGNRGTWKIKDGRLYISVSRG